ncbi:MAG: cation acetate symporter, partial [Planctomycetaceae bacterium]|nr:cation acetate symporter [Planctomycetaceae bacterium]
MIYQFNLGAVLVFAAIVALTLVISFYFGKQAKSASGFFAAAGGIPWFVNGVAFAGDYLSAASFLGICGMIAFYGYDGFLYSIGYLAGWVVALFVIAEPLKRLGRYTFADALDSKFQSRGIKLAAAISTLAVSIFYLIPQMVGAGVLVTPLFGLPHWVGVVMVGAVVILIVVTAGMVSTTYVQFLKGSLLVVFSALLVWLILDEGLKIPKETNEKVTPTISDGELQYDSSKFEPLPLSGNWKDQPFVRLKNKDSGLVWTYKKVETDKGTNYLETQTVTVTAKGKTLVNGLPHGVDPKKGEAELKFIGTVDKLPNDAESTGPLGPLEFFRVFGKSDVALWPKETLIDTDGATTSIYVRTPTSGKDILRPGNHPSFKGIRKDDPLGKVNFLSLMLALFCGTASLPHILIRYYTVSDQAAARKSTIVGIGSIGFFYILTLYMGLGAMTSGGLDVTNSNMA